MRRAGAAVAILAALMLSACGQSAEQHFRTHDLRPLTQQLEQRQSQLAAVVQMAHPGRKRDARAVSQAVDDVAATTARLAALRPPGSVTSQFARYTAANAGLVRALRAFAQAMRSKSVGELGAAASAARDAAGAVRRADDALEAALVS